MSPHDAELFFRVAHAAASRLVLGPAAIWARVDPGEVAGEALMRFARRRECGDYVHVLPDSDEAGRILYGICRNVVREMVKNEAHYHGRFEAVDVYVIDMPAAAATEDEGEILQRVAEQLRRVENVVSERAWEMIEAFLIALEGGASSAQAKIHVANVFEVTVNAFDKLLSRIREELGRPDDG